MRYINPRYLLTFYLLTPTLCQQGVLLGSSGRAVMLQSWEGNRRSGVALAMRQQTSWFTTLAGRRQGDYSNHTYGPIDCCTFTLPFHVCPVSQMWTLLKLIAYS